MKSVLCIFALVACIALAHANRGHMFTPLDALEGMNVHHTGTHQSHHFTHSNDKGAYTHLQYKVEKSSHEDYATIPETAAIVCESLGDDVHVHFKKEEEATEFKFTDGQVLLSHPKLRCIPHGGAVSLRIHNVTRVSATHFHILGVHASPFGMMKNADIEFQTNVVPTTERPKGYKPKQPLHPNKIQNDHHGKRRVKAQGFGGGWSVPSIPSIPVPPIPIPPIAPIIPPIPPIPPVPLPPIPPIPPIPIPNLFTFPNVPVDPKLPPIPPVVNQAIDTVQSSTESAVNNAKQTTDGVNVVFNNAVKDASKAVDGVVDAANYFSSAFQGNFDVSRDVSGSIWEIPVPSNALAIFPEVFVSFQGTSIRILPIVRFKCQVSDWKLKRLTIIMEAVVDVGVGINITADVLSRKFARELTRKYFNPMVFFIGGFPIELTPCIILNAELVVKLKTKVTVYPTAGLVATFKTGVSFDETAGLVPQFDSYMDKRPPGFDILLGETCAALTFVAGTAQNLAQCAMTCASEPTCTGFTWTPGLYTCQLTAKCDKTSTTQTATLSFVKNNKPIPPIVSNPIEGYTGFFLIPTFFLLINRIGGPTVTVLFGINADIFLADRCASVDLYASIEGVVGARIDIRFNAVTKVYIIYERQMISVSVFTINIPIKTFEKVICLPPGIFPSTTTQVCENVWPKLPIQLTTGNAWIGTCNANVFTYTAKMRYLGNANNQALVTLSIYDGQVSCTLIGLYSIRTAQGNDEFVMYRSPNSEIEDDTCDVQSIPNAITAKTSFGGGVMILTFKSNWCPRITLRFGTSSDTIQTGSSLYIGQSLVSSSATLTLGADGNLATSSWNSNTAGQNVQQMKLDDDGYLRLYDTSGRIVKTLNADGPKGAKYFRLGSNCSMMLYAAMPLTAPLYTFGLPCSASSTQAAADRFTGVRQIGGNMLFQGETLYRNNALFNDNNMMDVTGDVYALRGVWNKTWTTGAATATAAAMTLQYDGNLVIFDDAGKQLWQSNTAGKGATVLRLEKCKLTLWQSAPNNGFVWSSVAGDVAGCPFDADPLPAAQVIPQSTLKKAHKLTHGSYLLPGQSIRSNGGILLHQPDGNVVLYSRTDRTKLWETKTSGCSSAFSLQYDGKLALYSCTGSQMWSSPATTSFLEITDTCTLSTSGSPLFTGSCAVDSFDDPTESRSELFADEFLLPGDASFSAVSGIVHQPNGVVAFFSRNTTGNRVLWSSNTAGKCTKSFGLDETGNVKLTACDNSVLFQTNTNGSRLILGEGCFAVDTDDLKHLWTSATTCPKYFRIGEVPKSISYPVPPLPVLPISCSGVAATLNCRTKCTNVQCSSSRIVPATSGNGTDCICGSCQIRVPTTCSATSPATACTYPGHSCVQKNGQDQCFVQQSNSWVTCSTKCFAPATDLADAKLEFIIPLERSNESQNTESTSDATSKIFIPLGVVMGIVLAVVVVAIIRRRQQNGFSSLPFDDLDELVALD